MIIPTPLQEEQLGLMAFQLSDDAFNFQRNIEASVRVSMVFLENSADLFT